MDVDVCALVSPETGMEFNLPKAKHKELFAVVQRVKGGVTD